MTLSQLHIGAGAGAPEVEVYVEAASAHKTSQTTCHQLLTELAAVSYLHGEFCADT